MRGRGNAREVELGHLRDCVEDVVQLPLETLDLILTQLEARQVRDVKQLFSVYGHLDRSSQKERAPAGALSTLIPQVL
jgi:hypothetical protein